MVERGSDGVRAKVLSVKVLRKEKGRKKRENALCEWQGEA